MSASLALAELLLSGVQIAGSILGVSLCLFAGSALLEGAITLAVIEAFAKPSSRGSCGNAPGTLLRPRGVGLAALLLAAGGVVLASTAPDGIAQLARQAACAAGPHPHSPPFKDCQATWLRAGAGPAQAGAGLVGLLSTAVLAWLVGRKR